MPVKIKDAPKPAFVLWEDIKVGEGAQAVGNPSNILLKVGHSHGLRLQADNGNPAMSAQTPGSESPWYRCNVDIVFQPVVEAK